MEDKKIIPDKIIFSKRKTLAMQIRENGVLIVRAPIGTNRKKIANILSKYKEKIKKRIALVEERKHIPKKYISGEKFMLFGKSYPLEIIEGNTLRLHFKDDKFYLTKEAIPYGKKLFTLFYKKNTLKYVREQCEYYAQKSGLHYNKVKVTLAETRWGSCSFKNNLNFSYRLAMAPPEIINYVIVHEISHIVEKNHSKNFWEVVQKIMPDAKERRKQLRKNERFFKL